MRIKSIVCLFIILSLALVLYFVIGGFFRSNTNFDFATNSKNADVTQESPDKKESAISPQISNKDDTKTNPKGEKLVQESNSNKVNNSDDDEMLNELSKDVIREAERQLELELSVNDIFTKEEKAIYEKLLNDIEITDNPQEISLLADLITCIAERYNSVPESKNTIYRLITKALNALEKSKLYNSENTNAKLQRVRLLIWKYDLERRRKGFYKDIPSMDINAARKDYAMLQQIKPSTELEAYIKTALLYQAELPMTLSLTLVKPIDDLLDMQPDISNRREAVDVAKIRAWALFEKAKLHSLDNTSLLPYRALYYQYAIDFCSKVGDIGLSGAMNTQDKDYLNQIAKKSVEGLSEVRQLSESKGINLEAKLSQRRSVNKYFNYIFQ